MAKDLLIDYARGIKCDKIEFTSSDKHNLNATKKEAENQGYELTSEKINADGKTTLVFTKPQKTNGKTSKRN